MPQTHDKDGRPNEWGYACGYIERKTTHEKGWSEDGIDTKMWMEYEHYHVRQYNWKTRERVFWTVFGSDEFLKARELFDAQPGRKA